MSQAVVLNGVYAKHDLDSIEIDVFVTDSQPQSPPLETILPGEEVPRWFAARSTGPPRAIRLLSRYQKHITPIANIGALPYSQDVITQAIWSPSDYCDLWHNPAGGSAALLSSPWRFIIQTPSDGGSFCSLALSVEGHWVKGVHTYSDPFYAPSQILECQTIESAWVQHGLQILSLPLAFLRAHSARMAKDLAAVVAQVSTVEIALGNSSNSRQSQRSSGDLEPILRKLHTCSTALVNLERRSKFELGLISSIEDVLETCGKVFRTDTSLFRTLLSATKTMVASRTYDSEILPERIQNQRSMISNLVVQHNQQVSIEIGRANMEIAESSRRIAEATMSDSASMKTIAILTMVFLPGTAVASFFSMTMFNWSAGSGHSLVTRWLWVYFVAAIPLTGIVLAIWWICARKREKELRVRHARTKRSVTSTGASSVVETVTHGPSTLVELQDLSERQDVEEGHKPWR